MIRRRIRSCSVLLLIIFAELLAAQTAPAANARPPEVVVYTVSLANPKEHLVHVSMTFPATTRQVQLPVWNALYQVRDFAQYVRVVTAKTAAGQALAVRKLDKSTWQLPPDSASLEYDIVEDTRGPFNAQLNEEHAFFNLAEILMYPVGERSAPMMVSFTGVPAGWKIATALPAVAGQPATFLARNYDQLVDSPVEIGTFQETSFQEGGATYRIVVHGNPADYNLDAIAASIRKIVAATVEWMGDRPFQQYTFIYHLPRGPAGGGMEHAYSTAIDVSANALRDSLASLEGVTAHEFFHLWNVKRIRPATLEPVDYTKENYTRALWFSEGVDSAVTQYILQRAGLRDEKAFLRNFSGQIRELQRRPAHVTQSVEESSLDAWLEKYGPYNQPQRSVNYYNKGELLGYLLDLTVRQASNDRASLRDVFKWMNEHYAKQGKFFPDSDGVRAAAEVVSGAKLDIFFQKYVSGTEELPYDELLQAVGLRLDRRKTTVAALGFEVSSNGSEPVVGQIEEGSTAQKAGLAQGDIILAINDQAVYRGFARELKPGNAVKLKVRGRGGERDVSFLAGSREEEDFVIVDREDITPAQRARRALWLDSEDAPAKATGAVTQ